MCQCYITDTECAQRTNTGMIREIQLRKHRSQRTKGREVLFQGSYMAGDSGREHGWVMGSIWGYYIISKKAIESSVTIHLLSFLQSINYAKYWGVLECIALTVCYQRSRQNALLDVSECENDFQVQRSFLHAAHFYVRVEPDQTCKENINASQLLSELFHEFPTSPTPTNGFILASHSYLR